MAVPLFTFCCVAENAVLCGKISAMGKIVEFVHTFPEWAGRIITPVHVTDLAREYSFDGKAMWDTSSEISVISDCVAKACRLQDFLLGNKIKDMTEEKEVKLGVVLMFPGGVQKYVPLSVAVLDGMNRDVDVILGMDLIGRGDFSLTRQGEALQMKFVFGERFIDA